VLYDPEGLNREELLRLTGVRKMVEHFDRRLLSKGGFFVSVSDREVTLPDGTIVPNGEDFRNRFHLHPLATADLFVPCGGRPGAININNWMQLIDEKGRPKFRIIIEGANLFITEEARLRLEERGVILIKDASTNKGGVTSSSLEVLVSLVMNDEEFEKYMWVKKGRADAFRKRYVEEIIETMQAFEGMTVHEAQLTYKRRQQLPDSAFCGPNRSYPAHDASHVRNAFARLSQFGHRMSPALRSRIHGCLKRRAKAKGVEHQGCKICKQRPQLVAIRGRF